MTRMMIMMAEQTSLHGLATLMAMECRIISMTMTIMMVSSTYGTHILGIPLLQRTLLIQHQCGTTHFLGMQKIQSQFYSKPPELIRNFTPLKSGTRWYGSMMTIDLTMSLPMMVPSIVGRQHQAARFRSHLLKKALGSFPTLTVLHYSLVVCQQGQRPVNHCQLHSTSILIFTQQTNSILRPKNKTYGIQEIQHSLK